MRILSSATLLILMTITLAAGALDWEEAARHIRRVSPTQFRELPTRVAEELVKRGCTIPQTYATGESENVIKGAFAKQGQTDWAVLCSRDGSSSLLVFWGAGDPCPAEFRRSEDGAWLQDTGTGAGYSRAIFPVGKKFIDEHYKAYAGPTPPPIGHEGIEEAFIEKGSTVHYCHEGEWLELTGTD